MEGLKAIADKGESPAITTEAGLKCLATIRKTADKSGRIICTIFESLPPRDSNNEDYYKKTRLPISLETIEAKLKALKYNTMTEVESDLKRMVQNVKESHYKKSQAFEDAERVRKAVSNYMVKHNPAYLDRTYSAFPTPFPPSEDEEMADASESVESTNGDEMDVDDDANDQAQTSGKSRGGKGKNESENESDDESEAEEDEDDKDDDEEEDEKQDPAPMPPITPAKRRGRPPRSASATAAAAAAATASVATGTRHSTRTPNKTSASSTPTPSNAKKSEEELLRLASYKGLTFQEAQEKIVEELLHKEEDGYEGPYYEAFINLPPRELKDYYQVISEPLSLRKLKKHVQGFQTKKLITGVTQFRTWKAFEEKASLLWSNAYYYNEEGSEIYDIAKDLEAFFKKHLKEAKTHTIEPTPSTSATKVILKSRTPTAVPPSKIILHASRNRRDYTPESPAVIAKKVKDDHRVSSTTPVPTRERTKAKTVTPAPPSAADSDGESEDESGDDEEMEDADADADADGDADADADGDADADADADASDKEVEGEAEAEAQPEIQEPPVKKLKPVALTRYPGKTKANANLQRVAFQTINMHHKPHQLIISAHNTEMRQHHSYHLDGTFLNQKMRIVPKTLPGLFKNRYVRFYITADKVPLEPSNSGEQPNEHYFETILHRGVNTMEVHCIAGPPEGSELPDGARYEVEVMAASFNVYTGY